MRYAGLLKKTSASLVILILGLACAARAEDAMRLLRGKSCASGKISVDYRAVPLRRVLADFQRHAPGVNLKVKAADGRAEEELLDAPVTLFLAASEWDSALNYLAEQMRLTLDRRREGEGLVFLEQTPRFAAIFNGVALGVVSAEIARLGGAGVIFSPGVDTSRPVYLTLMDAPWREALASVLSAHSCVMVEDTDGVVRIVRREEARVPLETRLRPLRYVLPGAKLSSPDRDSGDNAGKAQPSELQTIVTILDSVASPRGSIGYEPRTNTLVLTDTPDRVREMLKIVSALDQPPAQVLVETYFVTIDGRDGSYPDVKWDFDAAWKGEMWDGDPVDADGRTGVMTAEAMSAFLTTARYDHSITIVQAPRMLVMDGEEASVFVGDLRMPRAGVSPDGVIRGAGEGGLLVGSHVSLSPVVFPGADQVALELVPSRTGEPLIENGGPFSRETPIRLAAKAVRTRMVLRSGQTGVISGMFDRFDAHGVVKPAGGGASYLGNQVAVGSPLSSERIRNTLILVTATVIPPDCGGEIDPDVEEARRALAAKY